MSTRWKREARRRAERPLPPTRPQDSEREDNPVEWELAAEWGERLAIGKMIARGGKNAGVVPGAMEQPT